MPHLATLNACRDVLADFLTDSTGHHPNLPGNGRGQFAPYSLNGAQVGAVGLLLGYSIKLTKQHRRLKRQYRELQQTMDASISDLDPDRQ